MSEKKSKKAKPSSKKKITFTKARARKVLRGPLFWIILALILVSFFGRLSSSGDKFTKVETSTILAAISANKVDSVLVIDRDQKIEVVLKPGNFVKGSKKLYASYVSGEEPQIIELLTSNPPPNKWDVKVPTQSFLASLFLSLIPLLLIGFLLLLFMANAQGGNRVFSFGKSKAKLQTK
jgi:cell division protease FtsH